MSKQDGHGARTAADLERKYNFGQTFAEVYGLVRDAQTAADKAQDAFESLDTEEIFNRLTNYGEWQGIYRGDDGGVYINASFIKSGKIEAGQVEVEAATITGQLVATQIDTKDLKVLAANIDGTLTAGQIDATNLEVSAANITGKLTASQMELTGAIKWGDLEEDVRTLVGQAVLDSSNADYKASTANSTISAWTYTGSTQIDGRQIYTGTVTASLLQGGIINIKGADGNAYALMYAGTNSAGTTAFELHGSYGMRILSGANTYIASAYGSRVVLEQSGAYIGPTVYQTDGTLLHSDRNVKHDIEYELDAYDVLFDALRPARFKLDEGTSDRYHMGMIAQDVLQATLDAGLTTQDFAAYCEWPLYAVDEDGNQTDEVTGYRCALRYDEFISLNIRQIQRLKARVAALEEKLA